MKEGVASLYAREDPTVAVARFREVLQLNARHYGAAYQLAKALDMNGDTNAALDAWQFFRPMAVERSDTESLTWATTRINALEMTISECETLIQNRSASLDTK